MENSSTDFVTSTVTVSNVTDSASWNDTLKLEIVKVLQLQGYFWHAEFNDHFGLIIE